MLLIHLDIASLLPSKSVLLQTLVFSYFELNESSATLVSLFKLDYVLLLVKDKMYSIWCMYISFVGVNSFLWLSLHTKIVFLCIQYNCKENRTLDLLLYVIHIHSQYVFNN